MLSALAIPFPSIDPIALELGPLVIRWYALAYIIGILLGWRYIIRLDDRLSPSILSEKARDDLMVWGIVGIILGGRLGYVIFYNPGYYLYHPEDILAVWKGGMAFHGGLLGTIVAFYLFSKHFKAPFFTLMDLIACAAPIGLFFGRIANFINGELYGRITNSSLGVIFPNGGPIARHPSQLYEAALEGLLLFIIMLALFFFTKLRDKPGALSGVFLIGYGISRSVAELFREPDAHLGFIVSGLTMGQLLSFPMVALGIYLIWRAHHAPRPTA